MKEKARSTVPLTRPLSFQYGAPGEIRTPDHLVRSQVLYPAELRARGSFEGAHPTTTHFPPAKRDKSLFISHLEANATPASRGCRPRNASTPRGAA
jgi:hypothetical protein